jgi:hypothetical protein
MVIAAIEISSGANSAYAISGFAVDVSGSGGGAVLSKVAGAGESNSYSLSWTGTNAIRWVAFELSGMAASSYFDQSDSANIASGNGFTATTAGALAQASEWGIVASGWNGNIDTTTQAFTNSWVLFDVQNSRRAHATKIITAGSGTESTTFSYTGTVRAGQYVMATYKGAGAAAVAAIPVPNIQHLPFIPRGRSF